MVKSGGALKKKKKKKRSLSSRGMQCTQLPVLLLLLTHFASVFPEVFVSLDVEFNKVADFYRVDFTSATVTNLRKRNNNYFVSY